MHHIYAKNALTEFIDSHPDWKDVLSNEDNGFAMTVKNSKWPGEERLWMFSYDQISSNFRKQECVVARGIILEITDGKVTAVVRRAFDKFFNSREGLADKIDWSSPDLFISAKMDGSICELYNYAGKWHWSTSGMFHAEDANLSEIFSSAKDGSETAKTFMDLISFALKEVDFSYDSLDPTHTYSFELTSPSNRIVTPYQKTELTFIGERDNVTGYEVDIRKSPVSSFVKLPIEYKFSSLAEAELAADLLPGLQEGFVIRGQRTETGSFTRNKCKNREYVKCHHIRGESDFALKQLFEVAQANETGELEAYYPEVKPKIAEMLKDFNELKEKISETVAIGSKKLKEISDADPLFKFSGVNVYKKYAMYVNSPEVPQAYRKFMFLAKEPDPALAVKNLFKDMSWKDYKALQLSINGVSLGE